MVSVRFAGGFLAVALGATVGIGGFTFFYGEGAAYLTSDPVACTNCHVMKSQYDGWLQSSHRSVATCNDCHAPHTLLGKYWTKARNGWAHSAAFTTGRFPETIRIRSVNLAVTEDACRYCHEALAAAVDGAGPETRECVTCHSDVGHRDRAPLMISSAAATAKMRPEP